MLVFENLDCCTVPQKREHGQCNKFSELTVLPPLAKLLCHIIHVLLDNICEHVRGRCVIWRALGGDVDWQSTFGSRPQCSKDSFVMQTIYCV